MKYKWKRVGYKIKIKNGIMRIKPYGWPKNKKKEV